MTTELFHRRLADRRVDATAVDLALGTMRPSGSPSHSGSVLVTSGDQPYDGTGDEVVVTAPLGGMWRHEIELGTPVWMWESHGWIQVGRVLEEVEDPAWAVDWLQSNWPTPSHRSRTALHP